MKILGIDYGRKHVGMAITDDSGMMAFPFKTIEVISRKQLFEALERIVEFEGIVQVVVGMPLTMHGVSGAASVEVQKFITELEEYLNVSVDHIDERLSTAEAKRYIHESGSDDHALAAQLFLDAYLRAHSSV